MRLFRRYRSRLPQELIGPEMAWKGWHGSGYLYRCDRAQIVLEYIKTIPAKTAHCFPHQTLDSQGGKERTIGRSGWCLIYIVRWRYMRGKRVPIPGAGLEGLTWQVSRLGSFPIVCLSSDSGIDYFVEIRYDGSHLINLTFKFLLSPQAMRKVNQHRVHPFIHRWSHRHSSCGCEGVDHALNILHEEFTMNVRLIGARNLKENCPRCDSRFEHRLSYCVCPSGGSYGSNCERVSPWAQCLVRNSTHFSSDVYMQHASLRGTPPAVKL
jgi:hypothetical protein